MADNVGSNIGDIIDQPAIEKGVAGAIVELNKLDTRITEITGNTLVVSFDAKGIENMNALVGVAGRAKVVQEQLKEAVDDAKGAVQQFGQANVQAAGNLLDLQSQLKAVNKQWDEFGRGKVAAVDKDFSARITEITCSMQTLGAQTSATTNILNTQINVLDKNTTSLSAVRQQMVALLVAGKELTPEFANLMEQALKLSDANYKVVASTQAATKEQLAQAKAFNIAWEQGQLYLLQQENIAITEQKNAIINLNTINRRNAAETRRFNIAWEQGEKWQAQQAKIANSVVASNEKQSLSYQMLAKAKNMALRFPALLAEIAILTALFEAIGFVSKKLQQAIPGTDAYIAKQEKMTQATDAMKTAFKNLGDELERYLELQRKSTEYNFLEKQIEDLKLLESAVKRKGELDINGDNAAEQQHKAAENRRKEELASIDKNVKMYEGLTKVMRGGIAAQKASDAPHTGRVATADVTIDDIIGGAKSNLKSLNLPDDFFDKLRADIEKSVKDKGNLVAAMKDAIAQYGVKLFDFGSKKTTVSQQTPDEINAQHNAAYDKRIELEKSFATVREQLRQANEEQDSESLDKIVADTDAKYKVIIANIEKERKKFVESYTGDKNDAEYKKALGLFGSEVSTNQSLREQEKHNKDYERGSRRHSEALSTDSKIASDEAGLGAASLATSDPNYNKMIEVLDKQTEAKKTALRNDFEAMKGIYDSDQIIELQKQQDEKLKQVDRDAYKERLGYATAYFNAMAQKIASATDIKLNENSRRHFNNMAAIISGKGSDGSKNVGLFNEDIQNQRADAHLALEGIGKQIPLAQGAYGKADAATKGPLSADAKAQADEAKAESKKNLEGLYTQEAEQNFKLVDLDKQVLDRKKQGWKEFYESLPDYAQQAMSAIKQIQDNQFAAEQQQLEIKQREIELQSEQQIRAIDATAGFEITKDNEKQKVASQTTAEENSLQQKQNQLALKKAKSDKQAAEATILASTAAAIMKIWEGYADQGEVGAVLAAAETAVVAGIGAAQYAAAASAPIPQFAEGTPTGGTTQRIFIAGEAGPEVIAAPGKPAIVVDKATIFNEDLGTQVIPMSRMYEYAAENVGKSGRYDAGMQAVYNNEVIMREVARIIGEKYEEGAGEIVKAVRNSGNRVIKNTVIITNNDLSARRL